MCKYKWLVLPATKDEAAIVITHFCARAEAEAWSMVGTLRTDHGGEFTAKAFMGYCADEGIQHHLNVPYTPQ
jgi:transposase InsO family protein